LSDRLFETLGRLRVVFDHPGLVGAGVFVFGLVLLLSPLQPEIPGGTQAILQVALLFLVYGLLVTGVNLQYGFTGLVNFGHVAFFAVGAYAAGMLTASDPFAGIGLGLHWTVGLLGAILAAALLGALVGASTLRLRDDFLAIATIATAEIVHDVLIGFESVTGGNVGLLDISQPVYDLANGDADTGLIVTLVLYLGVLLAVFALLTRLTSAAYGDVLRAIRSDELATQALGKSVFSYKMQVFVYGTALAGLAGGLWALALGAISPGMFTIDVTITLYIAMYIGGIGTHRGALLGLFLIVGLRLFTRFLNGVVPLTQTQFASGRLVLIGLILIFIIRFRPQGLLGDAKELGLDS